MLQLPAASATFERQRAQHLYRFILSPQSSPGPYSEADIHQGQDARRGH